MPVRSAAGAQKAVSAGPALATYPSGLPRTFGAHVDGRRHGRWREWHASGRLWLDGEYVNGKRHGPWREYDAAGTPMFEGTYVSGLLDGPWKTYCEHGGVASTGQSVAGKLEGKMTVRRCRQTSREEQTFVANRPEGVWQTYDDERLSIERTYKAGLWHGEQRRFNATGEVTARWAFKDGVFVQKEHDEDAEP